MFGNECHWKKCGSCFMSECSVCFTSASSLGWNFIMYGFWKLNISEIKRRIFTDVNLILGGPNIKTKLLLHTVFIYKMYN